ncbi:MAG: bifunctional YncE family protein/alkaline phosphatase family protein [Ignavibacteriae bacterium]|nr:bifunctional YncE family protein/alkaline phosphatase family protein [Ignavibacteriota bacterium]
MKLLLSLLLLVQASAQTLDQLERTRIHLPNGWGLTAVGKSLPLGDLPLNIAVSPDGKTLAVTNNGQSTQSIQLIDIASGVLLDTKEVRAAWLGLAWSDDAKTLYASGGNQNCILRFSVKRGKLVAADSIALGKPWPEKISVAGIALDDKRQIIFAATKEDNSLYVLQATDKKVIKKIPLGGEAYTCVLSPEKDRLYVSCWGCDKILVVDTHTFAVSNSIVVGDNPNELLLTRDGGLLYVSNANDNSVSVIDTKALKVIETLNAALYPDAPSGSTTNGIALDAANTTLFVANADNNCLAVFDVSTKGASASKGFIPTGWYPTCVRVAGATLLVANGKGFSSLPNPLGPNPARRKASAEHHKGTTPKEQYIAGLLTGTLSMIPIPDHRTLGVYSQAVYGNTPYSKNKETQAAGRAGNPIPMKLGDTSPIKHVFYIIKENRTYDQVLGDMPEGNGDTSLVLFGERVTPNQHLLAREFVLLDNFYVDGEVSADGHNWSTGAYATDYLEKTWPTSYGGRGGGYDAEGHREIANNKRGFIWDYCKRYGVSYRTYGEFADNYKPNIPALAGHFCPYYTGWEPTVMDTTRVSQWKRDFDSLLAINAVPQLNTLRFINDHTEGLKLGRPTPFAAVADNDLAVGLFLEYLSRTPIWKESVVFIVEDDAQNGPDHVDAHRSTAFVAGGFVKRRFVDHTMYSTSGMLRTIELILGLPPMSQYDAGAEPLWRCFTDTVNAAPFRSLPSSVDLFEKNIAVNEWQRKSEQFYFGKEDRAPDAEFNDVLWVAVKGTLSPPPRRAAFVATTD